MPFFNPKRICVLLLIVTASFSLHAEQTGSIAKITVIIDDVGDSHLLGLRAAKLPSAVALSILPHTPFSAEIAEIGHSRGMNILLHQPMESVDNVGLLGPGALLGTMERQEFAETLENNLHAVPYVIGINNHMGSLLTSNNEKMNWLMSELKQRDIFFVDSRTTTKTVAASTAEQWQIPTLSRKVFLDHYDDPELIAEQFQRLLHLAEIHGHAIAIGHPRKNTLMFLERELGNGGEKSGAGRYQLVSLSDAMQSEYSNKLSKNSHFETNKSVYSYDSCYNRDIEKRYHHHPIHTLDSNLNCPDNF